MTDEIEKALRAGAAQVAEFHAARPIPELTHSTARRSSPRTRVRVVLAFAAVGAIVVSVVAIAGLGERKTIAPASPAPTATGGPVNQTAPIATGVASNSIVPAATVTTASPTPAPNSTSPTTRTAASSTSGGLSLAANADQNHVAALGTIPDGYRVVSADAQPSLAVPPGPAGQWTATYVRPPVDGQLLSYIQISIVPAAGTDPYNGLVDATHPDTTIGPFIGRWFDLTPTDGFANFASPLGHMRLLEVGGRATHDEVQAIVASLRVDQLLDPPTINATPPDGFTLVHTGDDPMQSPRQSSSIVYAKGHAQSTAITIRTSIDPARAAVMTGLGPDRLRIIDVNGVEGILVRGVLTFDVTPTYQVSLTVGGPAMWSYSENINLLAPLARSIVAIDETTFAQHRKDAAADPFTPTDGDCESYMTFKNAHSTTGSPRPDGTIDVNTPGTITVSATATQPLANVDFFIQALGQLVPIGNLPALDGTATATLTWDGTINGQPAPATTYTVIAVRADPADPTIPDVCTRHSDQPHISPNGLPSYDYGSSFTIGANFVVAGH